MASIVRSFTLSGIEGHVVEVETMFYLVPLPFPSLVLATKPLKKLE